MNKEQRIAELKRELTGKGYASPTRHELYIYLKGGEDLLYSVVETAFRYGYWEARELEIDPHGDNYRIIQKVNRVVLAQTIAELLETTGPGERLCWKPASDKDMIHFLKNKYATKLDPDLERQLS